jgi:hypothetical protein
MLPYLDWGFALGVAFLWLRTALTPAGYWAYSRVKESPVYA